MVTEVVFLDAPVAGAKAHMLINEQETWSEMIRSAASPSPGRYHVTTMSGHVYEGCCRKEPVQEPPSWPAADPKVTPEQAEAHTQRMERAIAQQPEAPGRWWILSGILMFVGIAAMLFFAFAFDQSIASSGAGRVNNIGLMGDRQIGVFCGFASSLFGLIIRLWDTSMLILVRALRDRAE